MYDKTYQLLGLEVRLRTDCPEVGAHCDYMVVSARQDAIPVTDRVAYDVSWIDGQYHISENGFVIGHELSPEYVLVLLYGRIHHRAFRLLDGIVKIHAACGTKGGNRFIVSGARGAGKTTLVTSLLYDGFAIHGDEAIYLDGEAMFPFPRRFHLKPRTLDLVPQLAALRDTLPAFVMEYGDRVLAFDPGVEGFTWEIRPGPVDYVFFIEPNHGAESRIVACSRYQMVQNLMSQTYRSTDATKRIRVLCRLVDKSKCYTIFLGDISGANLALKRLLD